MASIEKANRAAEDIVRNAGDSYGMLAEHAQGAFDRNIRFARGWLDGAARELSSQSEANREAALREIERAEARREAFQTLAEEAIESYLDLLFAPLVYYKQGLRSFEGGVTVESFPAHRAGGAFPILGYDQMSVAEISKRLDGLTVEQVEEIRAYEKRNKNRESLVSQLDRRIKNAS